jgi:hypothetical protein
MTITRVQGNSVNSSGSVSSQAVTLPSGVTLGNLIVASVATGSNNTTFTGPSGWTQAVINQPAGASATIETSIWYLVVAAGQVGQTSFTWTLSASHSAYICISEWSSTTGWQASPVDVAVVGDTAGSPTTATTIVSGTTSATAQASELWIASLAYKGSAQSETSITSGWTKDLESTLASNNTMTMLYQVASATGAAACQYSIGSAQFWAGVVATFMPASAGGGGATLTLYGSNVADGVLTTASDMSTTTGGTETSATTTATGVAVWTEVLSRSASIATVSAIGSPSGNGWTFSPGAGTIAAGLWSASVTLSASSPGTTDITIRFYKYSSGTYTSIGTINKTGVTGTKTTYNFTASSFSSVTFGSSDLLYIDLWWHDTSGADDAPIVYVSSSASAGVAGDMQVSTPAFTSAGTTTSATVVETATGSEAITAISINLMSIIEAATGTEIVSVSTVPGNAQLITEFAPGSESVSTFTYYRAQISETPSSSEVVNATAIKLTSVIETASGSGTVQAISVSVARVTEAAPGSGTATSKQYNVVFASIVEAASGSEIILTSAITVSAGNVQMTASDMAFQYQRIMTSAAGSLVQVLASIYYGNSTNSQTIYGELDALLKSETIDQLHEMRLIDDVTAFLRAYNYATTVQADQPIAYYRLGESSGALANDIAGRSFNATINGGVTLGQAGALAVSTDTAILLNGSSGYLALPFGVNPTNWGGLTLEIWVKLTNNSFINFPRLLANEQPASSKKGFDLALAPSSDGHSCYFILGFGSSSSSLAFGSGVLAASSWYHVVCTWNGATMTAYINGAAVGTLSAAGSLAATTNLINIGRSPATGDYLPGAIDEVAIYNYALSAGRIAAHYSAAINP